MHVISSSGIILHVLRAHSVVYFHLKGDLFEIFAQKEGFDIEVNLLGKGGSLEMGPNKSFTVFHGKVMELCLAYFR